MERNSGVCVGAQELTQVLVSMSSFFSRGIRLGVYSSHAVLNALFPFVCISFYAICKCV